MRKIIIIIMFTIAFVSNVKGAEALKEFDFNKLEEAVEDKTDLSFNDLLKNLIEGKGITEDIKNKIWHTVKSELFYNNSYLKVIIVISIISAGINIAAADIRDKSVAELVALIGQIMIIGVASASFKNSINLLLDSVQDITDIINSAVPFIIMLLTAAGKGAAVGGGGIIAIGAVIAGTGIKTVIVPVLVIATLIRVLNILSKKQLLNKLSELFMKCTSLGLKACAYGFVFLIGLERVSGGAVNKSIGGTLKSAVKMVPVIGDVIGGTSDIAINTISTISNGVGIILVAIIAVAAFLPIIEIGIAAFLYKLIAAILEPVCDKQTIEIIDAVGESNFMILSALFIVSFMFIMACAIILCGVT